MTLSRRLVLAVVALVALGAALVVLVPSRFRAQLERPRDTAAADDGARPRAEEPSRPSTPTSEALIAAALEDGDLTYEESLLQRAYAIFDDPRLEPAFRSPVIDWEAGAALLDEIEDEEGRLSKGVLADLEPFRARPTDPISIFNRPRADVVKTQFSAPGGWFGLLVPGTSITLWVQGTKDDWAQYERLTKRVWDAFANYFPYPMPDNGRAGWAVNPDTTIDVYLVSGSTVDPRSRTCSQNPNAPYCRLGSLGGISPRAGPTVGRRSSGYAVVNSDYSLFQVTDTLAHELAHVTQRKYDLDEMRGHDTWFAESTATWVAYKVMKKLSYEPTFEYAKLDQAEEVSEDAFFKALHLSLNVPRNRYGAWLFFYYASMTLGDRVVTSAWERAARPGRDGIRAVNAVIPLNVHFPRFAVRNWNDDPVPDQYKTKDDTFDEELEPDPITDVQFTDPRTEELPGGLRSLASEYHRFTFTSVIRRVTFQSLPREPNAHVWAIYKIRDEWKAPEDWTGTAEKVFCREVADEELSELVLVVSNSHMTDSLTRQPKVRVVADGVGCADLEGWATSTLRLKDDAQDMTYVSNRASLRFRVRTVQDQPGNVQYDLMPASITWSASGTKYDCTVKGQMIAIIPRYLDQPLDPTRPAFGYLNVVGLDGGDFHSVQVSAVDPAARMTKTCPGDPPVVTEEPFESVWLLNVLRQANTHDGGGVVFKGKQTLDPARVQDNVPLGPGQALPNLSNAPGLGAFMTPEIQRALKEAQQELNRVAAESGKVVYTFEWELKPAARAPATNAP